MSLWRAEVLSSRWLPRRSQLSSCLFALRIAVRGERERWREEGGREGGTDGRRKVHTRGEVRQRDRETQSSRLEGGEEEEMRESAPANKQERAGHLPEVRYFDSAGEIPA